MSQIVTLAAGDIARLKRAIAGNVAFSFGVASQTTSAASVAINFSAGVSSANLASVTFSDSNNVSFGLSNGVITAIANTVGGGAITNMRFSAGTYSTYRSDLTFGDSNGVSFGQDTNGLITATVATNYQSQGAYLTTAQPPGAYLTTAALSQDSSKYAGTNGAITGGSFTLNTSGATISLPAYLTTAMGSDASSAFAGTGFTTATTAGTDIVGTLNTNGLSIGVPAYLTTAAAGSGAGTGFTTATTAGTNVVGTLDTNGLSMGVPPYLTTAQPPGAYLTTAMASDAGSNFAGTNGSMAGGSFTLNTSGATISLPAYLTTAQPPGAYLTTAALSQDSSKYAGTSTGMAGGSVTLNTSGISISLPAYLTTAQPPGAYLTTAMASDASSAFAGTGATIAGGSMTVNTAGVNISLPAYLTTAQPAGTYVGVGFTSTSTAGTAVVATLSTNGLSMGIPAYLTTAVTATSFPRLDQVLDPTADKVFSMGSNQLQLSWATGGSFSTNATRQGFFELDVAGNLTQEADVIHAHQHGGAPTLLDILHIEGDGANVTGMRLQMGATVAAEVNMPIKFTTRDTAYSIGSVPMILGTEMSNSVANLNANYLQGRQSSQLAGIGFSSATTAGTNIVATLSTNGLSMGVPAFLTTAAAASGAGTGFTSTSTAGAVITAALDTNGLSMAVPNYLTTAAATNVTSDRAGTGTSVVTTGGTDLTFAVNTAGETIAYPKWITTYVNDLTSGRAGTNTSVVTTGGTDLSFAVNTSGVTIAYPKWITTAGGAAAATVSYFANLPYLQSTLTVIQNSNSAYVFPVTIPVCVSGSYMRFPVVNNFTSTTIATSAVNNATGASTAFSETCLYAAVFYTMGTGTASRVLQYLTSASCGMTWAASVSQASTSNASRQSITQGVTWEQEGSGSTNLTTQYSVSTSNGPISTTQWVNLQGNRYLDMPFAQTLGPGVYWIAVNRSSGTVGGKNMDVQAAFVNQPQVNQSFSNFNGTGAVSNACIQPAMGIISVVGQQTSSSLTISNITPASSAYIPFLQIIRQA